MILTRTPFRIPLGGGGTDLPAFYEKHGGFLFSVTINKYMYVGVNYSAVEKVIRVTHSDAETANSLEEIKHELAKQALVELDVPVEGLEIVSFADLPPGTGMGSSGSYLVGLLRALHEVKGKKISSQELAELACHIEINILKKPVGKQDQYLAAMGGFVEMEIEKDGKVNVTRPKFSADLISELQSKTMIFYTHKKHVTVDILKEQSEKVKISGGQVETAMLKIKDIGRQLKLEMEQGKLDNFGKLLHEHWLTKKTISTQMSDSWLDEVYNLALQNGAEGGKIMGSGGGGLFLFFVPNKSAEFKLVMEKAGLTQMPYEFSEVGSEVIKQI